MPIPVAVPLIASFLGGLFGSKKGSKQTSSTVPTLDPAYSGLQSLILPMIQNRLKNPTGLPTGFESSGISAINRTYAAGNQSLENILSSRGLGTSPIAGSALARRDASRLSDISNFRTQIPIFEKQARDEDLATALQVLGLGRGSTTTYTEGGGGFGSALGGGIGSLAGMIGFLMASGLLGGKGGGAAADPTLNLWGAG